MLDFCVEDCKDYDQLVQTICQKTHHTDPGTIVCFALAFLGSRDGAVVRALTSNQCGLHLILAHCHMWVEFVVDSCLVLRVLC